MNSNNSLLTIIIPTHNRVRLLESCIQHILQIYDFCNIIIGDNSNIKDNQSKVIAQKYNCKYLDLRKKEGSIAYTYIELLKNVKTQYVMNIEDDDIIINKKFHHLVYNNLLKKNKTDIILYNYKIDNYTIYENFYYSSPSINDIPKIWNGNFKFDTCYFKTEIIQKAIDIWIRADISHLLDVSIDEAIVLIALSLTKKYVFIGSTGVIATYNYQTECLTNPYFYLYSSRSYIFELAKILMMDQQWIDAYCDIQFKCITKLFNISRDEVFNNKYLLDLSNNIAKDIKNNISYMSIKKNLYSELISKYKQKLRNGSKINNDLYLK